MCDVDFYGVVFDESGIAIDIWHGSHSYLWNRWFWGYSLISGYSLVVTLGLFDDCEIIDEWYSCSPFTS